MRCSERKQPSTGEPSEFSESPEKRALGSSLITSSKFFVLCFPVRIGAFAISPAREVGTCGRGGGTKRARARARGIAERGCVWMTPKGTPKKIYLSRKKDFPRPVYFWF